MAINFGATGSPGGEFRIADPVNSFVSAVLGVATRPADFFRGILRRGDYISPAVYALVCFEVFAILNGIIQLLLNRSNILGFLLFVIFGPIIGVIGFAIVTGIYHLLTLLIVGPQNSGVEATLRVTAYSATVYLAAWLLFWVPFVGPLLLPIGFSALAFFGIREMHATTQQKAAMVVGIPLAIVLILFLCLAIVAASFIRALT